MRLSIIVPVYNTSEYLSDCLDSIINQTFTDIEIICVNDGSTDNSLNILNKYAVKDTRIKVVSKENDGVSSARNAGLKIATGEYVTFVDSDDILEPNTYEVAMDKVCSCDMVCFGIKVFGDKSVGNRNDDEQYYKIKYNGITDVNKNVLLSTDVSSCNKIFKMDTVRKYVIEYPDGLHYEDADFYWKYTTFCNKIYFINEYFYNYRRSPNSIIAQTFNKTSFAIEHLYIVKDLYLYWKQWNKIQDMYLILKQIFKYYIDFAYCHSPENDKKKVLETACLYAMEMFKEDVTDDFINALKLKKFNNIYETNLTAAQKLFLIKNMYRVNGKTYTIIYFLGLKFSIRKKEKRTVKRKSEKLLK